MCSRGRHGRGRSRDDGWGDFGGYMNAKRQKLQDQFQQDTPAELQTKGTVSNIFNGISIHVDGYTKPSSDELKRMMLLHGGGYEHYLYRTRVSHVIATNLPNSKVRELRDLKVVRPEWITDSITAGKLLPYSKYLLFPGLPSHQKGLQTYTTKCDSCPFENSHQSIQSIDSTDSYSSSANENNCKDRDGGNSVQSASGDSCIDNLEQKSASSNDLYLSIDKPAQNNVPEYKNISPKTATDGKRDISLVKLPLNSHMSASDPRFLKEFYSNSRLHFLSTWKADFKKYVNELQNNGSNFSGRERLRKLVSEWSVASSREGVARSPGTHKRCIMHIDMDCFFVSVGLRKRPELRGKPVAVTHSKGRSAVLDPKADLKFERHQWELKRPTSTLKETTSASDCHNPADGQLDTDSASVTADDGIDCATNERETSCIGATFHSMAEVACCSYEARQAGVCNGMLMGKAKAICPDLVTIPYDFEGYNVVSKILYDTVASYTHDIEAVSCDELLVDCTDLLADTGSTPLQFATLLRQEIFEKSGCPASAGMASNIFLARLATKKAKPNGQFYLTDDMVQEYIVTIPVNNLPGVGWSLSKRFEAMNVTTVGDLQKISLSSLQKEFGSKIGHSLHKFSKGLDDRPVKIEQQRKSVSAEVNYGIRFSSEEEAMKFIKDLSEEVCSRLQNIHMKGKTITLKLMVRRDDAPKVSSKFMGHGICNNLCKSVTLPMATDEPCIVAKEIWTLLKQFHVLVEDLRGIGIQLQKLEPALYGTKNDSKKMPSILNFTISKNTCIEGGKGQVSTENISTINKMATSLKSGEKVMKAVDLCSTESMILLSQKYAKSKTRNSSSGNVLSRTKTLFEIDIASNKTDVAEVAKENNNKADETEHSEEIVEMKRTKESELYMSEDLLEGLGRRLHSDTCLPPLPCLPDISTPESTDKTEAMRRSQRGQHSDCQYVNVDSADDKDYFPSPSQIDQEVLKELPADIRKQIEKEVQIRKDRRKCKANIETRASSQGCSHWQIPTVSNQNERDCQDTIVPLPSPSQLDESCFNALPKSLQDEICQAYVKQESMRGEPTRTNKLLNLQQAKPQTKSPSKRSPNKTSPHFKVPHGKLKKSATRNSSRKLVFKGDSRQNKAQRMDVPTKNRTIASGGGVKTSNNITNDCITIVDDDGTADTVSRKYTSQHAADRSTDVVMSADHDNNISLCGARDLDDVRKLIKEWIFSTPEPQCDDEQVIIKYLEDLICDKNLELVDLVLKFIFRIVEVKKDKIWIQSLQKIYFYVQSVVLERYGSRLASIKV